MRPVTPPRFGSYYTIDNVNGTHIFGIYRMRAAKSLADALNNVFPYVSPSGFQGEDVFEQKERAEKYHPIGQVLQAQLKAVDPDYRADPFAVAVCKPFLSGVPMGIATGQDARFLARLHERLKPLYKKIYQEKHEPFTSDHPAIKSMQALQRVIEDFIVDLSGGRDAEGNEFDICVEAPRKEGHLLDMKMVSDPDKLHFVEEMRIH